MKPQVLRLLLGFAALVLSSGAFAERNYHLSRHGMCNKTQDPVRVSYQVQEAKGEKVRVSKIKPHGISKHGGKDTLAPGKCATLSFAVGVSYNESFDWADIRFHANEGWCEVSFRASKHGVKPGECRNPQGIKLRMHHQTDEEHFKIDIEAL